MGWSKMIDRKFKKYVIKKSREKHLERDFSNDSLFNRFIFFCDERFVELTNSDSNYKAIEDGLLSQNSSINQQQVFKLNYTGTVQEAAQEYEAQLKTVFKHDQIPQFDLLVLGEVLFECLVWALKYFIDLGKHTFFFKQLHFRPHLKSCEITEYIMTVPLQIRV